MSTRALALARQRGDAQEGPAERKEREGEEEARDGGDGAQDALAVQRRRQAPVGGVCWV